MGYRRDRKVFRLNFTEPAMHGLIVEARSLSLDKVTRIVALSTTVQDTKDATAVAELFDMFSEALVSWNLEEEDGTQVPATRVALGAEDFDFALAIVLAWLDAVVTVPVPLSPGSPNGGLSPGVSIPMAPLSPSHPSL
jgi:hypothetical protein